MLQNVSRGGVCPLGKSRSALVDGLWLIPEDIVEHIIVETDSQKLVSLWNNRRKHRSELLREITLFNE
jgi:hypothetical protein